MARDLKIDNTALDPNLYNYRQARDVSKTQVDWASLTQDLSNDLATIRDEREKTRQDAIDANRELIKNINDLDPYAHETANTKIQGAAYEASQLLSSDFQLVVNGQKKLKDYKQTEQLLSDNFNSLKGAMDTYNDHFVEAEERIQNGEANIGEIANNESLAGFGSLSALNIVVQPSGAINLVKKQFDANGNEIEVDLANPANLMSLTHVNDRVQYKGNYEDPNETAQATVETLGAFITAEFMSRQAVATIEDFRQMRYTDASGQEKSGNDVINSMVNEIITTDNQKLSLLQLAGFSAKDVTQDPEEAKRTGKILQIPNKNGSGMMGYEFTEEQEAILQDQARMIIERQIDSKMSKVKGVAPPQTNVYDYTQDVQEEMSTGLYDFVNNFVTGDAATSDQAATSLATTVNMRLPAGTAAITGLERIVDSDGQYSFVIKREGMQDKVLPAGDKTTGQIVNEVFDLVNTDKNVTSIDAARDYRGTVADQFGVGSTSITVTGKAINAPNFGENVVNFEDGTGQPLSNLINVAFGAQGGYTGSYNTTVTMPGRPRELRFGKGEAQVASSMKDVLRSAFDMPGAEGLRSAVGNDYDVRFADANDGNRYLFIEVGGTKKSVRADGGYTVNQVTQAVESAFREEAERLNTGQGVNADLRNRGTDILGRE